MIYIITHKKFKPYFQDKLHYQILHVGTNQDCAEDYLRDDSGNQISEKNPSYCELTGLYWIWKNVECRADEITGLVHYRRYFTDRISDLLYTYFHIHPRVISYRVIQKKLEKADVILPVREKIFRTVAQSYADVHNLEDLLLTRKAIEQASPDYVGTYDKVMNSHYYYYANMIICRKKMLDQYCTWLFVVLEKLEPMIDLTKYEDPYQRRVFGFLAERLLQVWVIHNQKKIEELPVFNTEQRRITWMEKNLSRLQKLWKKLAERMNGI